MNKFNALTRWSTGLLAVAIVWTGTVQADHWADIDETDIELFLPGQASWEWLLIPTDHGTSGARRMRESRPCLSCHQDEQAAIGNVVASGQRLEPEPLPGMPGTVTLSVRARVASDQLYLHLSWPVIETDKPAGVADHAAQVTVLVADDAVSAARSATCWASCHSDLPGMSADAGKNLTKYLANSRTGMTRTGGSDNFRSSQELASEVEQGAFLEFWSAALSADGDVSLFDGYILDQRHTNDDSVVVGTARREGDRWVVELQRPLAPGSGVRKSLQVGQDYPLSFAIHANHTEGRRHYVSFPLQLGIRLDGVTISEVLE
ncbi:MAG: ethylbenzene dehydrogenase-related protein [Wenzhouxiangella sp.]